MRSSNTLSAATNRSQARSIVSEAVPVATRLAVYADAYRLRLVDALAHNYPRLQQLLGADAFAEVARDYLDSHPSTIVSVRWFGDQLTAHLHARYPQQPLLAELAQWEWAIAAAFDSPDVQSLTEQALSTIDPAQWPALRIETSSVPAAPARFVPTRRPCSKRCPMTRNHRRAAVLEEAQDWLIWRQELTARYRSLAGMKPRTDNCHGARDLRGALRSTVRLARAGRRAHARGPLLKGWIREEMIVVRQPAREAIFSRPPTQRSARRGSCGSPLR